MLRKNGSPFASTGSTMQGQPAQPTFAQSETRPTDLDLHTREKAVALFHRTYQSARGYRDFVQKSGVDVSKIQRAADFERIPIMTKEAYIYQYPLADRLVDGRTLADCYMMTATTGSTGKPVLWPRDYRADQNLVGAFERVYQDCFNIKEQKTLHIIQNFLGTTPAGIVMSQLSWAASNSHQLTTITPGADIDRAIALIEEMGWAYDQIIVSTYPPYVSKFLDRAEEAGLNLADHRFKFVCTGEKFSEQWRNYMINRLGDNARRHDIISSYGCTEAGLLGTETSFSVALAEAVGRNSDLSASLFKTTEIPNIVAYNPMSKLLEAVPSSADFDEILITADQPVPLIRYNIHDRGGTITGAEIRLAIDTHNVPLTPPADDARFVYLLGRSDNVFLLTIGIYIEEIRYCLENSRFADRFTGEFQYGNQTNDRYEESLQVVVHLKQEQSLSQAEQDLFHQEFWGNLLTINPTLTLPGEQMLHAGMLNISYANGTDQVERTGKYKYFL